ncbi:MAG: hypothetical protein EOP04_19670 [Proteobacteria bacterium]|nr:MAG: hypothetical protein EOP04_19670 [Pseudomonadota bacterium]
MKNFGLTIPNHTTQIRRGLGWSEFSETYNAEVNYASESYILTATGIGGRPDDDEAVSEKGFAVSAQYLHLKPNFRLGGSYFSARTTDDTDREILGPNFVWGVTDRIYLQGEYDWVRVAPITGGLLRGYATYTQLGIEVVRGFDVYAMHEVKRNDERDKELAFQGYGPGLRWAPRPHFIFTGQWQKQKTPLYDEFVDSAFFVTQYWF